MNQQELKENIALYYSKLPPNAQVAFSSLQWMEVLRSISTKYNLKETQVETLATETTLAFLGIVSLKEYEETLINEISLPKDITDKMIAEINEAIFKSIRPEIEKTHLNNIIDARTSTLDPRFSVLPENVQKAISQSDYQKKLYAIGTKHKLQVARMASLEEVTVRFILGKLSPSQYENELALTTELPADKVREIAVDVNNDVMKAIRSLEMGQTENTEDDEVPVPPYAQQKVITKPAPIKSDSIYADAGIEMLDEVPVIPKEEEKVTMKEDTILARSGIDMIEEKLQTEKEHLLPNKENEKSALDGIENPVNVASSIIGEKLGGVITNKGTISDHSLPKINTQAQVPLSKTTSHDPYHEPIA
jgi:hypothetical protein